jgi:hypothetical protein
MPTCIFVQVRHSLSEACGVAAVTIAMFRDGNDRVQKVFGAHRTLSSKHAQRPNHRSGPGQVTPISCFAVRFTYGAARWRHLDSHALLRRNSP